MARKRPASSPFGSGAPLVAIVCCTAFSLGILSPVSEPAARASAVVTKTTARALPEGDDLGGGTWVGLNDPSIDQTALIASRIAKPVAVAWRAERDKPIRGY